MFNGIIFNKGIVKKIQKRPKGINIYIKSDLKITKKILHENLLNNKLLKILLKREKFFLFLENLSLIHNLLVE